MKNLMINCALAAKKTKIFTLFAAITACVSMFAANPTKADLQSFVKDGHYVACFSTPAEGTCNDIVWIGTYCDWTVPADLSELVQCQKLNGFDGWYVAVVPVKKNDDGSDGENSGKPVQLNECGKFDWNYQNGVASAIELVSGSVDIVDYGAESDLKNWSTTEPTIITMTAWKNSPCGNVCKQYTIRVYQPFCEENPEFEPSIMGSFNLWTTPLKMKLVRVKYFEAVTPLVSENLEFNFNNNPVPNEKGEADWSNKFEFYTPEDEENDVPAKWSRFGNFTLDSTSEWSRFYTRSGDTLTFNFSDTEKFRFARCDVKVYELSLNSDSYQGSVVGSGPYNKNTHVTFEAIPNYGYHFIQWNDGSTENPRTIILTQDTTYSAEFAENTYTITTESSNNEWGTTAGDTSALYLEQVEISAAATHYGYHFAYWSDGNTSNPRTIIVTEDKTYKAIFAKNTYSITKIANYEQGSISGSSQAEYLDEVTLTAYSNYGYHFVQWSDGITYNPRTMVITQDTTFAAEFAIDTTGNCGKDYALTWVYDSNTKTLTISGNGSFDEHMEYGIEAKQNMINLIINEGVTAIGVGAFKDCSYLTNLQLPASLKTIGEKAFANCMELTTIYNYRERPCIVHSTAFEGVNKFDCTLYVPTGSVDMYKSDGSNWKEFYFIKPFDAEQPQTTGYSITFLGKEGGIIDYGTVSLSVPTAPEINNFVFLRWEILSGNLEEGFKIQAIYEAIDPSSLPDEVSVPSNPAQKLIRNGNVYILQSDKVYTVTGQQVK